MLLEYVLNYAEGAVDVFSGLLEVFTIPVREIPIVNLNPFFEWTFIGDYSLIEMLFGYGLALYVGYQFYTWVANLFT